MSMDTSKIRSKLAKLDKSLDELESQLEPLLSKSLPETLLALDTIQQAKLHVIIPYVVYDLVFGERARMAGEIGRTTSFWNTADAIHSLSKSSRYRSQDTRRHR